MTLCNTLCPEIRIMHYCNLVIFFISNSLRFCCCWQDEDPYVRKTAAVSVAKLHDINGQLVEDQGFLDLLKDMLSDSNPMVGLLALHHLSLFVALRVKMSIICDISLYSICWFYFVVGNIELVGCSLSYCFAVVVLPRCFCVIPA